MKNYWLCLFTGTSWTQFLSSETKQVGFNSKQLMQARKIKKGDYLIAYLTKVSRFIAILEVTDEAIVSDEKKWTEGLFPVRVGAKVVKTLTIPTAIPMSELHGKLSFLKEQIMPVAGVWSAHVRSSPRRWKIEDGEAVSKLIDKVLQSGENLNLKSGNSKKKLTRKKGSLKKLNRVGNLNRRAKKIKIDEREFEENINVLSRNQVTGFAVNFPIQKTCRPTSVCRDTCYFAIKLNASNPALMMQHRNLYLCKQDPVQFAKLVIYGYDNAGLNYLRWNGGGDLFEEALIAIEFIRVNRPDIILWIVSRKAELAARINDHENHYIHLSLDRSLIDQKAQIGSMFHHDRIFFSYQVHPEEILETDTIEKVDLIFMHDYEAIPEHIVHGLEKFCPLNGAESITDACGQCRRCFDGSMYT